MTEKVLTEWPCIYFFGGGIKLERRYQHIVKEIRHTNENYRSQKHAVGWSSKRLNFLLWNLKCKELIWCDNLHKILPTWPWHGSRSYQTRLKDGISLLHLSSGCQTAFWAVSHSGTRALSLSLPLTFSVPVKVSKSKSKRYGYTLTLSGEWLCCGQYHLLDQFLATFFCKTTNILLGKCHFQFVIYLTRCRATLSAPSSCLRVSIVLSTLG